MNICDLQLKFNLYRYFKHKEVVEQYILIIVLYIFVNLNNKKSKM